MFLLYKYFSLPSWRNIIVLLSIILLCLLATGRPASLISYSDNPRWYNAWYKDEIETEFTKLRYDWKWCVEDKRMERMKHILEEYKGDEDYMEKIDQLCDRYNIDDDTERLTQRMNNYWEFLRRERIAIVVRNIIMRLAFYNQARQAQLKVQNYSVPKEMADCYMRVRAIFSLHCLDADSEEVKPHRYVFIRICESDWLNTEIISDTIKDICHNIKFYNWEHESELTPAPILQRL